jgi:hypothetical protein
MTRPSDDLQQRFRSTLPDTAGTDCPPPDDSWAAAVGELPFERVRALVDHGARCAQCAEAWRILAEVRQAAAEQAADAPPPVHPPAPRHAPRRRPPLRFLLPLALPALAAAVGVWLALRPPPPRPPPVERGNGGATVRAESPGVQPARDAVLRWSEVPGAASYNVTVLTPDLTVVHQALGVSARELRLPEAVTRRAPGGALLWNVDAVLPDGRTVASPTFDLQLK